MPRPRPGTPEAHPQPYARYGTRPAPRPGAHQRPSATAAAFDPHFGLRPNQAPTLQYNYIMASVAATSDRGKLTNHPKDPRVTHKHDSPSPPVALVHLHASTTFRSIDHALQRLSPSLG